MSRFILTIFIALLPLQLIGQMFPLSDQYLNNTLAINPAFAGCHDALSITLLYREQAAGFEGAPKNSSFSVHAPVKNNRVGLGFIYSGSSFGINSEKSFTGNYSYRIEALKGTLALGLGVSVTSLKTSYDKLDAADDGDQLLLNTPVSALLHNYSLGVYYYTQKYFAGISIPMFLSHYFDYSASEFNTRNDFSHYTYFLEGGYFIKLSKDFKLLPSLLAKYQIGHPVQVNINAQVILKDRLRLGVGYRNSKTILAMFECNLTRQLMAGYTYGYGTGSINKYFKGSHEVVLNYVFSFSRQVMSPRQF
jgi:type IX secretion system PorP/SprF family membrane protein